LRKKRNSDLRVSFFKNKFRLAGSFRSSVIFFNQACQVLDDAGVPFFVRRDVEKRFPISAGKGIRGTEANLRGLERVLMERSEIKQDTFFVQETFLFCHICLLFFALPCSASSNHRARL
jgi:hypothetical protein